MNISFPNSTPASGKVDAQPAAQAANKNQGTAVAQFEGASSSELSLSGTSVQALKAQLAAVPSVRQDRVQALQKAVENGTYKASSQQIAEAIHSDLFGAPSNTGA
ncbi:MAG: flagellar biosynthesis anti-sigma factor FlgM [Terriglobia bacterium]